MELIAEGGFGRVFRDGTNAKKVFDPSRISIAIREISIGLMVKGLNCTHLIFPIDYCIKGDYTITMPLALCTYRDLIRANVNYSREYANGCIAALREAVACMNSAGIMHRDIKTDNLLVFSDTSVKLADYSLSKLTDETKCNSPRVGTQGYMAPDLKTCAYGADVDLFATAITATEMALRVRIRDHEYLGEFIDLLLQVGEYTWIKEAVSTKVLNTCPKDCNSSPGEVEFASKLCINESYHELLSQRAEHYKGVIENIDTNVAILVAAISADTTNDCTELAAYIYKDQLSAAIEVLIHRPRDLYVHSDTPCMHSSSSTSSFSFSSFLTTDDLGSCESSSESLESSEEGWETDSQPELKFNCIPKSQDTEYDKVCLKAKQISYRKRFHNRKITTRQTK